MADKAKSQATANPLIEVLSGALRGLTTDTVGAPVDLINMALKAFGAPTAEAPVGGSKWMRKLLDQPQEDSGAATAGNLASALASPGKAAVDMAQMLPMLAGIFTGPKSKLWDKDAAEYLEAMEPYIKGLPPEEAKKATETIFQDLNVFRSPGDKQLRQEIPDNAAKLIKKGGQGWLSDFLDHPQLFEAYPQLKQVKVLDMGGTEGNASFTPAIKKMLGGVSPPKIEFNANSPEATSILLHEVQHAIQNLERFSPGGSSAFIKRSIEDGTLGQSFDTKAEDMAKGMAAIGNDPRQIANELYRNLAGEAEARLVQTRHGFDPQALRSFPPMEFDGGLTGYDVPLEALINRLPR